jgi:hypothetical protein
MVDIVSRAKNILLNPQQEWRQIAAEPADTPSLFTGYAAILALIPAVCGFIGVALLGSLLTARLGIRVPLLTLLIGAVVQYILGLVGVYLVGKVIQFVAPNFGGTADELPAMKLSVYSMTAAWLAGIFALIPPLAILGLVGLYSLYLFYLGAPVLARVPQDKAIPFVAVVIVVAIIVQVVVRAVVGLVI